MNSRISKKSLQTGSMHGLVHFFPFPPDLDYFPPFFPAFFPPFFPPFPPFSPLEALLGPFWAADSEAAEDDLFPPLLIFLEADAFLVVVFCFLDGVALAIEMIKILILI
jgi:hypothetical protein